MLRLLAGLAGVDDYETPAEQLETRLADIQPDPAARRAEVMAFLMAATGGDG
jgi:hypothetical protein